MDQNHPEDTSGYSPLAKLFVWFATPANANKIFAALIALCLLLFLSDFTYKKYGHFPIEKIPGFYGAYGFIMFTALILAAKTLRLFIKRDEAYRGEHLEHAEVELSRVGLARDPEGPIEAHLGRHQLVEPADLLVVPLEELEEAGLGSGRALDAPEADL